MGGHRVIVEWLGESIETLADLIPATPKAICVGINPAPSSVATGHYYQGRQGRRFFGRLRQAGMQIPDDDGGFEDDALFAMGIGFTDIVKRPTARASGVTPEEKRAGVRVLESKLQTVRVPVLIFPFKAAAVELVGPFADNGWIPERFAGARLFVMPGPYESNATASETIATLASGLT